VGNMGTHSDAESLRREARADYLKSHGGSMAAQVSWEIYENRENGRRHHSYEEEMKPYRMMQKGDDRAPEEIRKLLLSPLMGKLSVDPVRDAKYTFLAGITLTTRFAIEGGMDSEHAYILSDLYIRRMDQCLDRNSVFSIFWEMFSYFTNQMRHLQTNPQYSLHVHNCITYIDRNLHQELRLSDAAEELQLNRSYLSELFKKETGVSFSEFVRRRRIENAKNLLRDTDLTASEIAGALAFSSQSYFIHIFKEETGLTPGAYRKYHYSESLKAAERSK